MAVHYSMVRCGVWLDIVWFVVLWLDIIVWFVVLYAHYSMVRCVLWLDIIVWFVVLYGCTL